MAFDGLVALGCDPEGLREHAPLPPGQPLRKVPFEVLADLIEAGARAVGDDAVGLRLAKPMDPDEHGILALLQFAAPDVATAVRYVERFQTIGFDSHHVQLRSDGAIEVAFRGPERPALRTLREWVLAEAQLAIATLSGEACVPERVDFEHPAPADTTPHAQRFGCPIRFGAPRTLLQLSPDVLARPVRSASGLFRSVFERQAQRLLDALPHHPTTASRVREALAAGLPDAASIEDTAAALRMSPRTLQRRLREEGTSHGEQLRAVRRALAAQCLREGTTIGEVAWRLGYASPASFHRAFRGWYGTTPSAFVAHGTAPSEPE